ncbi:MAG: biliverdin-producing heme oxygenase [Fimbriimonadaceae bacterium]|nr:biliverdin-producing heme oxygenase [Fimbriimonadaceae bacterium]
MSALLTVGSAPMAHADDVPLSKRMRAAYRDLHDSATQSKFNQLALGGRLSPVQYRLFLLQRLATFEAIERKLYGVDGLPGELRGLYSDREHAIVRALRQDLGYAPSQPLPREALPDGTLRMVEQIDTLNPYQVSAIASIMIGGSAFGAQTLANKIQRQLGTEDVRGLRVYPMDAYGAMVGRLNRVRTPARQQEMIAAGRWFFRTQTAMNNGPEYD